MKKELLTIGGMTCSACSARIEKVISKIDGIEKANVNLLAENMSVSFDEQKTDIESVIKKVEQLGYTAQLKREDKAVLPDERPKKENADAANLKKRLIVSLIFTVPLFYLSMGGMLYLPIPPFFEGMENALIFAFTLFLLALPVVIVNRKYFVAGFKNLFKLSPNMDSLIAVGSGAAFAYGIFAIYKIGWGLGHGDMDAVHKFSMDLYFESAAVILTLITLGKYFEARAKSRTTRAIEKLVNLTPKTAIVLRDGGEFEIHASEVAAGDILIVKTGAAVPADGIIIDGNGSLDESSITGESMPVDKKAGDKVVGGTVNSAGYFRMEAKSVGADTAIAKIVRLVEEASSTKAPIAKLADKNGLHWVLALSLR